VNTGDIRFRRTFVDFDRYGASHFRVEARIELEPGVRLTAFSDPITSDQVIYRSVAEGNRLIRSIRDAGMKIEGPDLTVEDYYFRKGMA
jgi:hypothetical protein